MEDNIIRHDGRAFDQLRPVHVQSDIAPACAGSVLISFGNTQVICGVSVEDFVPGWLRDERPGEGWLTAEYRMLPYATTDRNRRETMKVGGRTMEIQRLIGRSLRSVLDMKALGPRSLWVDCDVLQADGGTRTASITGGFIALKRAVNHLMKQGVLEENPIVGSVAAISVGIVDGTPMLDLDYPEDVAAETDMNVVMLNDGRFVEVQGTAEEGAYSKEELDRLLSLADKGINELFRLSD